MPNRIIKESICTSDTVDELNWFEEVVFYRLMVNCDDYGRMDGRPAIIKSRLFPLKSSVTEHSVCEALERLAAVGLVLMYACSGRPYLQLVTWERHQRIRNQKSKYPAPGAAPSAPGELRTTDSGCQPTAVGCGPNPIQSGSKSESKSKSISESGSLSNAERESGADACSCAAEEAGFAQFWQIYPKQHDEAGARRAWARLAPDAALIARILAAVRRQSHSKQWTKEDGLYVPHPVRYLDEQRFKSVRLPASGSFDAAVLDDWENRYPLPAAPQEQVGAAGS
ncbi:Uncharacterised protein [Anaerotruncus sp. 2789STDY5834896]|uniref:Uncharacterized protein n=1 Tax=uncultured Anaerotruncus sp. TaxID=905011 RepID=A0A1C6GB21_9FIRM|nr:Uncharacterised protein [uncultured Anaerotruncus sp.]